MKQLIPITSNRFAPKNEACSYDSSEPRNNADDSSGGVLYEKLAARRMPLAVRKATIPKPLAKRCIGAAGGPISVAVFIHSE